MTAEGTNHRIRYEVSGGIACIRLERPAVNALDLAMVRGVIAALKRAAADDAVRAVMIASAVAKRFCAGLDIAELAGRSPDQIRTLVHELYVGLFDAQCQLGKPTIAAVNGAARGGGMTLAVSCDIVLAAESVTFGYPEIELGVTAGHSFCPPAAHYRPPPRLRAALHRTHLRRQTGSGAGPCRTGNGGAQARRRIGGKTRSRDARGARRVHAPDRSDYRRRIAEAVEDFCAIVTTEVAQAKLRAFAEKGRSK